MARNCDATPPPDSSEGLYAIWNRLNHGYFGGKLQPIAIEWSDRLTSSSGMFVSQIGPRHVERRSAHRLIRLSAPLLKDQQHSDVVATLAHEMIHQWQFDVRKRRPNHGPDFRRKMEEMNRDGLAISLSHELLDGVSAFYQYAWRCALCGEVYRRQRRTIRPRRHRCGQCHGPLRQLRGGQVQRRSERGMSGVGRPRCGISRTTQLELPLALPKV